jgi:hypothetical protein
MDSRRNAVKKRSSPGHGKWQGEGYSHRNIEGESERKKVRT